MIRALKNWLLWAVGIIAGAAFAAIATVAIILNTEAGTRWAIEQADTMLPGSLVVDRFDGTLWKGLDNAVFRYSTDEYAIAADGLTIRVNWSALALQHISIDRLNAASMRYVDMRPPAAQPAPLALDIAPLPVRISVERSAIDEFVFARNTRQTVVQDIRIRDAGISGTRVRAASLSLSVNDVNASATQVAMTLSADVPLSARIAWQQMFGEWSGEGPVRGSLNEITFDQAVNGPYPLVTSGTLLLFGPGTPRLDARINWESWAIGDVDLLDGEFDVAGWMDSYTAGGDVSLVTADGRSISLRLAATANLDGAEQLAATLEFDGMRADIDGVVTWRPALAGQAKFRAMAAVGGLDLTANGQLEVTPGNYRCRDCLVTSGPNRLSLDGALTESGITATWALEAPKPGSLMAGYSGPVNARGRLSGSPDRLTSTLEVRSTRFTHASWGDVQIDVTAKGTVRRDTDGVEVTIDNAGLGERRSGDWQLVEPTTLSWSQQRLAVEAHRWSGNYGELEIAELSASGDELDMRAGISQVPLDGAERFLPHNMQLIGTADADLELHRRVGAWSGQLDWQQSGTILRVHEFNDQVTDIRIPRVSVTAALDEDGLNARAALQVDPGVTAELAVAMANLDANSPMHAELQMSGEEFGWVSALFPQIDRFEGKLAAAFVADGPYSAPEINGNVSWQDGRLLIPALNVPLDDIDATISGGSSGSATLRATAKAGSGELAISGRFNDLMLAGRTLELQVTGKAAELVNWPEYRLWATPDLRITGDSDGWRLGGEVAVPRADITLREIPANAVKESGDVVVTGENAPPPETLRVTGEARLILGEKVHFNALGLDTRLAGDVGFRLRHDRPVGAEGTVSLVDGVFTAYGQKLTIRKGDLTFTGPLDDPLVDVTAVRVIDTIDGTVTAGLHIRGRAQDLTSTVFSEPAMAESDALSYLVLGRPLNEATEAEGGDLSGAAVALGLKQATRLTQQIGEAVGLDQLAFVGDGSDNTALVAGKQVNSRLYARYAYGVFSRLGSLLVRYKLSRRLILEAGAGEEQSIDILYSVERD